MLQCLGNKAWLLAILFPKQMLYVSRFNLNLAMNRPMDGHFLLFSSLGIQLCVPLETETVNLSVAYLLKD